MRTLSFITKALLSAIMACSVAAGAAELSKAIMSSGKKNPVNCFAPGLQVGWTHGQYSVESLPSEIDRAVANKLLQSVGTLQNQHIMGWGVQNPLPAPGKPDWTSLDSRIALIERMGGEAVVTLCCAPDWMKGGMAGVTDWKRLDVAPLTEYYDDFAELAAEVAARYPKVRYFQVWNELKGFWSHDRNRWAYEEYTDLYNRVYRAIKRVRPDAKVGGPYVVVGSYGGSSKKTSPWTSKVSGAWGFVDQRVLDVLEYWLANNVGADFVVVDGSVEPRDGLGDVPVQIAAKKFYAMTHWLRERTNLPIWWAEVYPSPPTRHQEDAAIETANVLQEIASAGGKVALLWSPQCTRTANGVCLWSYGPDKKISTTPVYELLRQRWDNPACRIP